MERGQPTGIGLHRWGGWADLVIGERHVFDRQHQLVITPVTQVRRLTAPQVEPILATAVHRERAFQADIHAVDLLREQHHVPVVRHGHRLDIKLFKI